LGPPRSAIAVFLNQLGDLYSAREIVVELRRRFLCSSAANRFGCSRSPIDAAGHKRLTSGAGVDAFALTREINVRPMTIERYRCFAHGQNAASDQAQEVTLKGGLTYGFFCCHGATA
jgi:hypothetical protein